MTDRTNFLIVVALLTALILVFKMGLAFGATEKTVRLRTSCDVERLDHLKAGFYSEID